MSQKPIPTVVPTGDVTKSVRFRSQWGVLAPEPHDVLDTA